MKGRNNYHRRLYEHWKFNHEGICPHCHKPLEGFCEEQVIKSEHVSGLCSAIIVAS